MTLLLTGDVNGVTDLSRVFQFRWVAHVDQNASLLAYHAFYVTRCNVVRISRLWRHFCITPLHVASRQLTNLEQFPPGNSSDAVWRPCNTVAMNICKTGDTQLI
ncbi:hypothetical protein NP493_252g01034 [Ridgeia piscesae]|uniref:Uncharacterized protein n=1 Tax=Ridgeia piscesae TaxID=27915 RepID=A0AAD9NYH3_RIDPI|nr:hypothetical protein NP493_252g01034 [Ridgeia piscesae]